MFSCNQPKKEEKQSTKEEQPIQNEQTDIMDKSVSLSVKPDVFKFTNIPDTVTVTMINHTNDTITTGLYYSIEKLEASEWKQVSPKDIVFHDLGWRLKPNNTESFTKKLYKDQINYTVGKYRIVKYYLKSDYQKTKEDFNIYAEFKVE